MPQHGAGDPRREPPLVPRLDLPPARPAAPRHVRRQGRVLRRPEDRVVLPGRRPDPDPARGWQRGRGRARVGDRGARARRRVRASTPRARAPATATSTAGTPAWPGSRSRPARRSCPVGLVGTDECQPTDKKLPRLFRTRVRSGSATPLAGRALRGPGRRPARPAPDHRRADVRDPRAQRLRVRRHLRDQEGRGRADDTELVPNPAVITRMAS